MSISILLTAMISGLTGPKAIKTKAIHHSQLAELPHSNRKLGPLPCREWERHLQNWFNTVCRDTPEFKRYFPDLAAYFSYESNTEDLKTRGQEVIPHAFKQQFAPKFIREVAKATGLSTARIAIGAIAYLELRSLAGTIAARQNKGLPYGDLINNTNLFLAEHAAKLLLKIVVI